MNLPPPLNHVPPQPTVLQPQGQTRQSEQSEELVYSRAGGDATSRPTSNLSWGDQMLADEGTGALLLNLVNGRRLAPKVLKGDAISPVITPSNRDCGRRLGLHNPFP